MCFGGRARDAFHLVLPTLPGYGFSGNPARSGWNPARTARAFHELMRRLGHQEDVSQGGDWGSVISQVLADQRHKDLLGMHVNMPGTVPKEIVRRLRTHDPPRAACRPPRSGPTTGCSDELRTVLRTLR
uniref:alpha/beta fold hydrolase n=1 Tax=Streptomyces sp. SAT1 TaxID=1849967 RepID=UPI0007F9D068|nr:alpha/beta hydrolase [Streptomyces sp. SAT1]ANO42157.1 hypothetical protein A8713_033410 [Streptomyces sp. SAT1]